MTPRQMYRAMRRWGISVVALGDDQCYWYAGDCRTLEAVYGRFVVDTINPANSNTMHIATTPEAAVEDYCNARNLEWDV